MANTFLDIVNAVLRRFNEVELTSSSWGGVIGFHAQVKDSVNASLRDIYAQHVEWPFNNQLVNLTLVPDQTRYAFPADARSVDGDSFRLRQNDSLGSEGKKLISLSYDEYLDRYVAQEDVVGEELAGPPTHVFLAKDSSFGFVPRPDKAYAVRYEYYRQPSELFAAADVCPVPEGYRYVVIDGACFHAHMFRDNMESAQLAQRKFEAGMKDMRKILVNRNEYMRSSLRG